MSTSGPYPAGKITVKGGHVYEVYVDDAGRFTAYHNGRSLTADSRTALEKDLAKVVRDARITVSVPFWCLKTTYHSGRPEDYKHGTATGLHAGNGNVLVQWDNGDKEQLTAYGMIFTSEGTDIDEWQRLRATAKQAAEDQAAFEASHRLDLAHAVREALDAAKTTGEES